MNDVGSASRIITRRTMIVGAFAVVSGLVVRLAEDGTSPAAVADKASTGITPPIGRMTDSPDGLTQGQGGMSRRPVRRSRLPRGGRTLFPRYRLVGYCGLPGSPSLGRLGVGNVDDRLVELEDLAARYAKDRIALPVMELVAVVAQQYPGRDGRYRVRIPGSVIAEHLTVARRHRALLLLNIQPGRASFSAEVAALERWLREPDVGLALDPEWAVGPGQVPGRVFGHVTGADLDRVCAQVSRIVRRHDLPEKALVVHQLAPRLVRGWHKMRHHPGVAVIQSVDGIGTPEAKTATWQRLVRGLPGTVHTGFKLFLSEDTVGRSRLMTPSRVLGLRPAPEYVMYE